MTAPSRTLRIWLALSALFALASASAQEVSAQVPFTGEVRQLVTFRFLPGRSGEALELYRDRAIPLYEQDHAMRSFRGLREVESPIPLDLIVVSSFDGMAGMDESNASLRSLAQAAGSSIGSIYGDIGTLSTSHDDQFVEMKPELGTGDATSRRLVALVWYRLAPGAASVFENTLRERVTAWEASTGVVSATGRFLVSDGWSYLRFLGFDSLGDFHRYWSALEASEAGRALAGLTLTRREVILAPVPEMSVR